MSDDWKIAIWQQLGVTIDMFGNALDACPDELWRERLWDHPSDLPEYGEFGLGIVILI